MLKEDYWKWRSKSSFLTNWWQFSDSWIWSPLSENIIRCHFPSLNGALSVYVFIDPLRVRNLRNSWKWNCNMIKECSSNTNELTFYGSSNRKKFHTEIFSLLKVSWRWALCKLCLWWITHEAVTFCANHSDLQKYEQREWLRKKLDNCDISVLTAINLSCRLVALPDEYHSCYQRLNFIVH